jgi:hypothetical protein
MARVAFFSIISLVQPLLAAIMASGVELERLATGANVIAPDQMGKVYFDK